MVKASGIVKMLKQERDRVEKQLSGLNAALSAFAGAVRGSQTDTHSAERFRQQVARELQPRSVRDGRR